MTNMMTKSQLIEEMFNYVEAEFYNKYDKEKWEHSFEQAEDILGQTKKGYFYHNDNFQLMINIFNSLLSKYNDKNYDKFCKFINEIPIEHNISYSSLWVPLINSNEIERRFNYVRKCIKNVAFM